MGNQAQLLKQAKVFGISAFIVYILGIIPFIGIVFLIAGLVLWLLSQKRMSEALNNKDIFRYSLYFIVTNIVGYLLFLFIVGSLVLLFNNEEATITDVKIGTIIVLVIEYVLTVISYYFLKKTYDIIGEKLNISAFKWGGLIAFIGAISILLFGLGFIGILVGWILILVGYFSISPEAT